MPDRLFPHPALLPDGLYDLLPRQARHERLLSGKLLDMFERYGYAQVSPPLMEYEASLLAGRGESFARQTFRVMDPQTQAMLAFRPDITMQVGRIARYRMADAARPLRLSYHGATLRVRSEPSDSSRQHRQAGLELIGADSPHADAEVMCVAVDALRAVGADRLTLDIHLPGLLEALLDDAGLHLLSERQPLRAALECKDASALESFALPDRLKTNLSGLLRASGAVTQAFAQLETLALPESVRAQLAHVRAVAELLAARNLPVAITLDPAEQRGFAYHHLISYSLFTGASGGMELGRGGRYLFEDGQGTGATLYVNALLEAVEPAEEKQRILVPEGLETAVLDALHAEGLATVSALDGVCDDAAARAQSCAWRWEKGKKIAVDDAAITTSMVRKD